MLVFGLGTLGYEDVGNLMSLRRASCFCPASELCLLCLSCNFENAEIAQTDLYIYI